VAIDDADGLYRRLEDVLTEAGFAWVLGQITDYLRGGRLEPVQVSTRANNAPSVQAIEGTWHQGSTKRNRYVRSVPFTESERLETMLEAIEVVTLEFPAMLGSATGGILADSTLHGLALVDESGRRVDLSREDAGTEELTELARLLDAAKSELR